MKATWRTGSQLTIAELSATADEVAELSAAGWHLAEQIESLSADIAGLSLPVEERRDLLRRLPAVAHYAEKLITPLTDAFNGAKKRNDVGRALAN